MRRSVATIVALALFAGLAVPCAAQAPAPLALIDINRSPHNDLESLPGVSQALAAAIVNGRPYKQPADLVRRNIIPQGVYDAIKDRIIAGTPPTAD